MFASVIQHGLLDLVEATTRSIIKFNSLLLWHHIIWIVFIMIASYSKTAFAVKLDLILDWFVVFEALLYAGLVVIRPKASWKVTRSVPYRVYFMACQGSCRQSCLHIFLQVATSGYIFLNMMWCSGHVMFLLSS